MEEVVKTDITQVSCQWKALQMQIVEALEKDENGQKFYLDHWCREAPSQGKGLSAVLENGKVYERAGVNFSHIVGHQLPASATQRYHGDMSSFEATGVSIVIHPRNPFVPTVHMNIRFFAALDSSGRIVRWWFGGGMDLTPYYGFVEDCQHFHHACAQALQPFGVEWYPKFKEACDRYFFIQHRQEARGIGGIFFDDFDVLGFQKSFALTRSVGESFLTAYQPIVQRRLHHPYDDSQRQFQRYRRGRYVEFNLVQDRGTLFGLQFKGRIESILMSMPPMAAWRYGAYPVEAGSEEEKLKDFLQPQTWIK